MAVEKKAGAVEPRTTFDWVIYADATLAGLSVLIPVPMLDLLFETLFKRRMLATIARRNGRILSQPVIRIMRKDYDSIFSGCLLWPIYLVLELLKRIFRTVLYFLTIKASSDQLSLQWHRAFLFDYMVRRGDLDSPEEARIASRALDEVLKASPTSPLRQLAQEVPRRIRHTLRTVWQFLRRNREDEVIINTRHEMEASWGQFSDYLLNLAEMYDTAFARLSASAVEKDIRIATDGGGE